MPAPAFNPCHIPVIGGVCTVPKTVAGDAFDAIVADFNKGFQEVLKSLMTFWISTPAPDLSSPTGVVHTLDGLTRPLVAFAAIIGLLIAGGRLAWSVRGGEESGRALIRGLLILTVVTGAGAGITELLLVAFDDLAAYVLSGAALGGKPVISYLVLLGTFPSSVGTGLVFVLSFFGMIASLVQVGIMLVRGAILSVLVGILPIAAAAALSDPREAWFKRLCGWIVSFLLYKLAAAVVYAAAFTMIGSSTSLASIISGYMLIVVAILALPALLRLLPPSAEAMTSSGGGGGAAAVGAAATGAVALGSGGRSGSAPAATSTPGLTSGTPTGPTGSGPPGSAGGGSGPSGTGVPAIGLSGAGGSDGGSAAAGAGGASGAASSGAAAAGPVGAAVAVVSKTRQVGKELSEAGVGEGEQQ